AGQWIVGFALETEDQRFRALVKLEKKCCDLIVSNGPQAMNATETSLEVLNSEGSLLQKFNGPKTVVARELMALIQSELL
ncbi:MAG: phosphopantothenoylcysteine decarboxylase, partial [Pirellulaceae bacterium]|nr:phosphopantothenoylcysteine decarboxylase [Pirellulaceae bacterium]